MLETPKPQIAIFVPPQDKEESSLQESRVLE
jgi:hypothetical protein